MFPPPPPPGPFPPFPGPGPFPLPIPLPIPIPGPFPPNFGFVTVVVNGGNFYPWITNSYSVRHFPGMNIGQALASTGVVRFNVNGRIISVNGIVIAGNVEVILRLNGRPIPQTLLNLPIQSRDVVGLEVFVRVLRGNEWGSDQLSGILENNFEELQRLEEEDQQ